MRVLFHWKQLFFLILQILFCSFAFAWMPNAALTQKRLSPVAGNPGLEAGAGFLDGVGSNARFGLMTYLTIDAQDNIYVVDATNYAIRKITPAGAVTTLYGGAGAVDGTKWSARFGSTMQGIAIDSSNNFYVVDSSNHAIRKITAAGVVTTLAGSLGVSGSADGTGAAARFNSPTGITLDSSTGNLFVADTSNNSIRKITSGGVVTTFAGTSGSSGSADGTGAAARFSGPRGMAIDSTGNLFVADYSNSSIRKITSGGVVTTFAGTSGSSGSADGTGAAARFSSPLGLAVDSSDNVWVADNGNRTIRKITTGGVVTTIAGSPSVSGSVDGHGSAALFNYPVGLAFDSSGNLFVSDGINSNLRKITPAADVTTFAGGTIASTDVDGTGLSARMASPTGMVIDSSDNIFFVESTLHTIRKVSPTGVVTTFAGRPGLAGSADGTGTAATFKNPNGIAMDSAGNFYVTDTGNQTIRKITAAGVVTTYAGSPGVSGSADGALATARFYGPTGITITSGDITYVSDISANTIRKISAGTVSTFAGKYITSGSADGTLGTNRFASPRGLAVDNTTGNIYVADYNNSKIRMLTPGGTASTVAGSSQGAVDGTGTAALLFWPRDVAVDATGNIYVADTNNNTIRKITSGGVVTTVAGAAKASRDDDGNGTAAGFNTPACLKFDSAGNLFIGTNANNIRKMTTTGDVTHFAGYQYQYTGFANGAGNVARFNSPRSMVMDGAKNIYVADYTNSLIRQITPAGVVSTFAGTVGSYGSANGTGTAAQFNLPLGLVIDSSGNFFVSEYGGKTIRKITPAGAVTLFAGTPGVAGSVDGSAASATFHTPGPMTIDGSDNIYLVETGGMTIRKITSSGTVSTLAGTYTSSGSADGTGASARFSNPAGIAIDSGNNLYVTDNNSIRKITSGGVVTTFAGTKGTAGFADGGLGVAKFSSPTGITIDKAGNLYVADTGNNSIRKVDTSGNVTTVIGGTNFIGLSYQALPASLAKPYSVYSNGGKLYITTEDSIVVTPNP